jgi:hypothetical protein
LLTIGFKNELSLPVIFKIAEHIDFLLLREGGYRGKQDDGR